MTQQLKQDLQLAAKLTEEMLAHAQQQEWEQIQDKEDQRKVLLENFYAAEIPESEGQEIGNQIKYILELNHQLTSNLVAGKQSLGTEISQLNRAKSATHAYLKFSK